MQQPTSTQQPAVQWAQTYDQPRLGDVEREAARGIPRLSEALEAENLHAGSDARERTSGFVAVLEDWIFPVFSISALFVSAYLVAPASWFGRSIGYSPSDQPGHLLEVETVNFSNVGSRLTVALLCAILGLILVATTIIMRSIQRRWRITTQFIAILVTIGAAINTVLLGVNVSDGFDELAIPLWAFVALTACGLLMTVMAFAGYRRGRVRAAASVFAALPAQQQEALIHDRNSALDVLVNRQIVRQKDAARVKRMAFGEFTGQVNVNREV